MKHMPSSVLRQASAWMARLSAEDASQADQQNFEAWRAADVQHEAAWQKLLQLQANFDNLTAQGVDSRLLDQRGISRRQLLSWGMMGLGVLSIAGGTRTPYWQSATADYRTAAGQTRMLQLRDNTEVTLNTRTRLDLNNENHRLFLKLHTGELLIDNRRGSNEALALETPNGHISLSSALCSVRCTDQTTRVSAFEGEITFRTHGSHLSTDAHLAPGKQVVFDTVHTQPIGTASPADVAWTQGQLVAERMPVDQFISELARYRQGVLLADSRLANLSVTGVFPTTNTDQALQQLTRILPVQVNQISRYWIRVVPA
ncbi:MAG: FecR domain-containing protein [Nitrincola lacisaponensis]|uniref:FecR domain-containing protein n=1 Tax=Nitrincola lacisaponensis TaxID=267850 RepID=UPI00391AEF2F